MLPSCVPLFFPCFFYLFFRYQLKHFLREVSPTPAVPILQSRSASLSITHSFRVLCTFPSFKHLPLLITVIYSGDDLIKIFLLLSHKLHEYMDKVWSCLLYISAFRKVPGPFWGFSKPFLNKINDKK